MAMGGIDVHADIGADQLFEVWLFEVWLLQDVPPAELGDHPFNRQPVGSGPWRVAAGQDWTATRSLRLTPNPLDSDWRPGASSKRRRPRTPPSASREPCVASHFRSASKWSAANAGR